MFISFTNYSLEPPPILFFKNKNKVIESNYYIRGEKLWSEIWTGCQENISLVIQVKLEAHAILFSLPHCKPYSKSLWTGTRVSARVANDGMKRVVGRRRGISLSYNWTSVQGWLPGNTFFFSSSWRDPSAYCPPHCYQTLTHFL